MTSAHAAFALLAVNPFGGLLVAIPVGMLVFAQPMWWVLLVGVPLAYLQVPAVDVSWAALARLDGWHRFLERRRSRQLERLAASRGAFFLTMLLAPLLGPWLVMAFMRYAHVPQRRVALPILLGLVWNALAIAACCVYLPWLFKGRIATP